MSKKFIAFIILATAAALYIMSCAEADEILKSFGYERGEATVENLSLDSTKADTGRITTTATANNFTFANPDGGTDTLLVEGTTLEFRSGDTATYYLRKVAASAKVVKNSDLTDAVGTWRADSAKINGVILFFILEDDDNFFVVIVSSSGEIQVHKKGDPQHVETALSPNSLDISESETGVWSVSGDTLTLKTIYKDCGCVEGVENCSITEETRLVEDTSYGEMYQFTISGGKMTLSLELIDADWENVTFDSNFNPIVDTFCVITTKQVFSGSATSPEGTWTITASGYSTDVEGDECSYFEHELEGFLLEEINNLSGTLIINSNGSFTRTLTGSINICFAEMFMDEIGGMVIELAVAKNLSHSVDVVSCNEFSITISNSTLNATVDGSGNVTVTFGASTGTEDFFGDDDANLTCPETPGPAETVFLTWGISIFGIDFLDMFGGDDSMEETGKLQNRKLLNASGKVKKLFAGN